MRVLVLSGAMQTKKAASSIEESFIDELRICDCDVERIALIDRRIAQCTGCLSCQESQDVYDCNINDDMDEIAQSILDADCIILSTPIYMYYCSAPMKSMLDRTLPFFRLNQWRKYQSPLEGKWLGGIIVYDEAVPRSQKPFESTIKAYANDTRMCYIGIMSEKMNPYESDACPAALNHARQFARKTAQ